MKQTTLIWLFNDNNEISLCMKKRGFGVGKLNGAGGKLNPGETAKECAVRELEEETGVKISVENIEFRGIIHFYYNGKEDWNQSVNLFTGKYNGDLYETDEMKPDWYGLDKIPYDIMWEDDKYWFPEIIAGKRNLEYKFYFDENGKILKYEKIR